MPSYKLITAAATDPVSVADFKAHQRIDGEAEDPQCSAFVKGAAEFYQTATSRQLVSATYRLSLPCWWDSDGYVSLMPAPVASITSIQYYDGDGVQQTWSSSNYYVDTGSEPGRVYLAAGASFPNHQTREDAIWINYVAGYGAASAVPSIDKAAIKLLASNWYENREATIVGTIVSDLPFALKAIIEMRKVVNLY